MTTRTDSYRARYIRISIYRILGMIAAFLQVSVIIATQNNIISVFAFLSAVFAVIAIIIAKKERREI